MPFSEACFKPFGTNLSFKYGGREALEYIHTYIHTFIVTPNLGFSLFGNCLVQHF